MNPTLSDLKAAYARKGYVFFPETVPFNVNLWGIRKRIDRVNLFDDVLGISCSDEHGTIIHLIHPATVDPGLYYLQNQLMNPNGTFILKPGQYRGCWAKGKHASGYECLRQKDAYTGFLGWRDNRLNGLIERRLDANGHFFTDGKSIHMHRSSQTFASVVGRYSAGCQVRQNRTHHEQVMAIITQSIARFGNSFSYTLFDEDEVFPGTLHQTESILVPGERGLAPAKPVWPESFMRVQQPG